MYDCDVAPLSLLPYSLQHLSLISHRCVTFTFVPSGNPHSSTHDHVNVEWCTHQHLFNLDEIDFKLQIILQSRRFIGQRMGRLVRKVYNVKTTHRK